MATPGPGQYGYADYARAELSGWRGDGREPGARRKKLAGYLKAANELRQTYFNSEVNPDTTRDAVGQHETLFPHAVVARSDVDELILFPSYARKHTQEELPPLYAMSEDVTEEEYWRRKWEVENSRNAIVDIDVRGWAYSPQRGPLTRKHRLLIGLARQLSGIPAPASASSGEGNDPGRNTSLSRQEEELIAVEAEDIVRKGKEERHTAVHGGFSETAGARDGDAALRTTSVNDFANKDRSHGSSTNIRSTHEEAAERPLRSKASWTDPSEMNSSELAQANAHLLTRLRPFMSTPKMETMVRAFFYNEHASREHITRTDASGHFTLRSALDFIPTHVRVVVGEDMKLSATKEVVVTAPTGVSMISDIDDTIKHSEISSGARAIFRNAFIRELNDLTVDGVREWYTTLQDMGVKLHYVSNSPWQMYPILTTYFNLAHLPKGSFHLKQYTGMLQGIFEPVAERKKGSLNKIIRDFPDRKFILVGDSGEADLEVYTEFALENPGKVIGIFIRDVTTTVRSGYFDPSYSPTFGGISRSWNHQRQKSGDSLGMSKRLTRPPDIRDDEADLKAAIAASLKDMEEETRRARSAINPDAPTIDRDVAVKSSARLPPLPPRRRANKATENNDVPITASPEQEDLIDFSDPVPPASASSLKPPVQTHTVIGGMDGSADRGSKPSPSPPPPPKPASLRNVSPDLQRTASNDSANKQAPPRPKKPSSAVAASLQGSSVPSVQAHQPSPLSQVTRQASAAKPRPTLPARPRTYREFAKEQLAKALPSPTLPGSPRLRSSAGSRVNSTPTSPLAKPMEGATSFEDFNLPESSLPPPPPPRRNISSYSLTPSRRHSHARSSSWDEDAMSSPGEGISKKEHLWKQRLARAQATLDKNNITLRTWKVGSDVADTCVKLVEAEMRRINKGEVQR